MPRARPHLGSAGGERHRSPFLLDFGEGKTSILSHLVSSDEIVSIFRPLGLYWARVPMWAIAVAYFSFRGKERPKILGHIGE
jgi:hypothetical protein